MYTGQLLFTEPGIIINPGMEHIIIQDPGHGDLTSDTHLILDGVSVGDTVRAGLVSDLGLDMDIHMADGDMAVADGGDLHFIILPAGVDGMVVQDPMGFMVIIFMFTITYMLITRTTFTGTGVECPARAIIAQVV
jgi:hypothetical protein